MTKRLLISSSGPTFKLVKPGFDVDTETDWGNILFDIGLGKVGGVYLAGVVDRLQMPLVSGGVYQTTIPFNKTFGAIPQITVHCEDVYNAPTGGITPKFNVAFLRADNANYRTAKLGWSASTTSLTIEIRLFDWSGAALPRYIYYTVLQV
jgi:hypothetical protein